MLFDHQNRRRNLLAAINALASSLGVAALAVVVFLVLWAWPHACLAELPDDLDNASPKYLECCEFAAKKVMSHLHPLARLTSITITRITPGETGGRAASKIRARVDWYPRIQRQPAVTNLDIWLVEEQDGLFVAQYGVFSDDYQVPLGALLAARNKATGENVRPNQAVRWKIICD